MSNQTLIYESFLGFSPYSTIGPYRAADYLRLAEGEPVELLKGRLIVSPCPTPIHQLVLLELATRLQTIADQTGGLVLPAPMDVVLSDHTILQPDVLLLRAAARSRLADRVHGPADLVVEILSPSTSRRDRIEKLSLYAEYGVPEFWIVDPDARTFDFLSLRDAAYQVVVAHGDLYQSPLFPEIHIDLAAFWQVIDRRMPQ